MPGSLAEIGMDDWAPWRPAELSKRLAGLSLFWCVVGGWALDLWHGEQTRDHDDLEFTVLREDVPIFRQRLGPMRYFAAHAGSVHPLAADEAPSDGISQIWCLDPGIRRWRADMMIEPGDAQSWVYKRVPDIKRPRVEMVFLDREGIPYLNPAAVLLFKAKYRRTKDETDFLAACPKLPAHERFWLKTCLETCYPGHEWAASL
jgi:hypothetical protein